MTEEQSDRDRANQPSHTDHIDHIDQADQADVDWFRTALAPAVGAEPVGDGWQAIVARASGDDPTGTATVVAFSPSPTSRQRLSRPRLALLAAAILVVVTIGAATLATRGDDPAELIVAGPPTQGPTGWYIPVGLDGWQLESVTTGRMEVASPPPQDDPGPRAVAHHVVLVTLRSTSGPTSISYTLSPLPHPHPSQSTETSYEAELELPGQPLPVHRLELTARGQSYGYSYVARWPAPESGGGHRMSENVGQTTFITSGTGEVMNDLFGMFTSHGATETQVEAMLASLRPATAVDWSAFLDSATGDVDDQARADRLYDLMVFDAGDAGRDQGNETEEGTGTTVVAADQEPPPGSGPMQTREQVLGNGLVATATWPSAIPTGTGPGLRVRVTFTNPTDQSQEATGCRWDLVRVGYSIDHDSAHQVGCVRPTVVPAGASIPHTVNFRVENLVPGRYHAVYESDREEIFRAEVVVLPPTSVTPIGLGPELQDLARRVVGRLAPMVPDRVFASTVRLGVGAEPTGQLDRADLAAPDLVVAATSLDNTALDHYAGRVSPFSVWELLALPGPVAASEGPPNNCFGTGTHPAPPTARGQTVVSLTRIGHDSCINWYAVAVVLDAEKHIVALHLYLEEP